MQEGLPVYGWPCPFPVERVGNAQQHGARWRVRLYGAGDRWHDVGWPAHQEAEAKRFVEIFRAKRGARSLGTAVTEYLDHLKLHGGAKRRPLKPFALRATRAKLIGILALVDREAFKAQRGKRVQEYTYRDRPIDALTDNAAQKLYTALVDSSLSVDTHRSYLTAGKAFGEWCVERHLLKANPFAKVLPVGELVKGKDQLRLDEARRFIAACYADPHPTGGVAAAAALTLGCRASEILDRVVRDLDDRGRVLAIDAGKSLAAVRRVRIPPILQARIAKLAEGQGPGSKLFGSMTSNTLLHHVRRLCEIAGVPEVCTHGLRGTHITLTVDAMRDMASASQAIGHANTGVTQAHYLKAGSFDAMRAAYLEELLFAPEDPDPEDPDPADAIDEEAELLAKLADLRAKKLAKQVSLTAGYSSKNVYPDGANGPEGITGSSVTKRVSN